MAKIHDNTLNYQAANVAYLKKVVNHSLNTWYSIDTSVWNSKDRQVLNTYSVLSCIDGLNLKHWINGTDFRYSGDKQIANKDYVDFCLNAGLKGKTLLWAPLLSGDEWNDPEQLYEKYATSEGCIANIRFCYIPYGDSKYTTTRYRHFTIGAKKYNTSGLVEKQITLFGDSHSSTCAPKFSFIAGEEGNAPYTTITLALEGGWVLYAITNGARTGELGHTQDSWGKLFLTEITTKLRTDEIFIPTPLIINTKTSYENVRKEFPIAKTGKYEYSFIAHNGTYSNAEYNTEGLVKFSIINQNGNETVLVYTDGHDDINRLMDEKNTSTSQTMFTGKDLSVSAQSKFVMECKIGEKGVGVVECLTIKGTI
jgi:hypothetical protein